MGKLKISVRLSNEREYWDEDFHVDNEWSAKQLLSNIHQQFITQDTAVIYCESTGRSILLVKNRIACISITELVKNYQKKMV